MAASYLYAIGRAIDNDFYIVWLAIEVKADVPCAAQQHPFWRLMCKGSDQRAGHGRRIASGHSIPGPDPTKTRDCPPDQLAPLLELYRIGRIGRNRNT